MPRQAAAVATAGGLMISTFGAAASQLTPEVEDATATTTTDLAVIAEAAQAALAAAPSVEVSAQTQLDLEAITDDGVAAVDATPAPPPPPPPPPPAPAAAAVPAATAAAIPPSGIGSTIVEIAARYQGVPYVWGGSSPAGFDCSGFTSYVFAQAGIGLPRTSSAQRGVGTVVPAEAAQPGDLMWWPGHVAIYAGNGQMIDASRPGTVIEFRPIWRANPTFIRVA